MWAGEWPTPAGTSEYALTFDRQRKHRVLVIPALFDEANKLRRFIVEVMRRLDAAGVDAILPDLPGTNESRAPLTEQTVTGWREAVRAGAAHFLATHVLTIRDGAICDPGNLPGLRYASTSGTALLRGLVRVQLLADKEAGVAMTREELTALLRESGGMLAGYDLSASMVEELIHAHAPASPARLVEQGELGGAGLWLRAEPAHDPAQADKLAALMLEQLE
jgi:hypothetical protein